MKSFSDEEIGGYIEAINKEAAQVWINAFAREPKLQQSYYWTLFSELFLKQLHDIPVSMSDAEKMIPQLSASQARRAIQNAKKARYLVIQDTGGRTKYVTLTGKTEEIVRNTSSKALQSMKGIFGLK